MKTKVGIIGSTGYTGVVLARLLLNHPEVEITYLSSEQYADKFYFEAHSMFYDVLKEKCRPIDAKELAYRCDLIFFATPNSFAKEFLPKLLKENINLKIIDLSSDFRLEKIFKFNKKTELKVSYGLPEIHREEIKKSQLIANPGCYPTSIILALAPLVKNKIIDLNSIIIDSKSGVSGAGKQPKPELHFCEVNESFSPYNLGGKHRHIPEIENELTELANIKGEKIKVTFSPHLLPINRGILSTVYTKFNNETEKNLTQKEIYSLYKDFYKKEFFVKILPEGTYANTKNVRYTNFCHITPIKDERTNNLIIVSSIDNMVKGASGQAIQNMNIILSLKEHLGLDSLSQIP